MTSTKRKRGLPLDRDEMIARVKALARKRGVRTLTRSALKEATGIGHRQILRHFASHTALIKACDLEPYLRKEIVTNHELIAAMHETFSAAGGIIIGTRFSRGCRYDRRAYISRWRGWEAALHAYGVWLEAHHPESPLRAALTAHLSAKGGPVKWKGCGGARLGAPISFPGLQHAPTNELGVVFLFGALAPSLGYLVESLGTPFPDCAAKRRLQGPNEPWERVRIEFEFKSRNFVLHKHAPKGCDLIVCWEDDWPDCPLEILELKREVERLGAEDPPPTRSAAGAGTR